MATLTFGDLYITECEHCSIELSWEWLEDEMIFKAECPCGTEYTLEPTMGVLHCDASGFSEDEDEEGN